MRARPQVLVLAALAAASCGGGAGPPAARAAGRPGDAQRAASPGDAPSPSETGRSRSPAPPEPPEPQVPLSADPRVAELAAAIEEGDRERAARLVLRLDDSMGLDAALLRARYYALSGSPVDATRALETARERWPRLGRVYAAQAELAAAAGARQTAAGAIHDGLAAVGPTAELERAQGIYFLTDSRTISNGLAHLVEARRLAPELPFTSGPLAEAHRLVGSLALRNQDAQAALVHARAGLAERPGDPDLEELLADALQGVGRFEESAAIWERFLAEGRECGGTLAVLHQRAATAALVEGDRPKALEHWLRARELGLSDDELGFGADALADEAERAIERGAQAWEAEDWSGAEAAFRQALRYAPRSREAQNDLAKALCKEERWDEAVPLFRAVWEELSALPAELPEPVHLNLARALVLSGHPDAVRPLLERYLDQHPAGTWADATREMLARLPQ